MDWTKRFADIASTFEVELPDGFKKFLTTGAPSKTLVLEDGFVRGPYTLCFDDTDLIDLHSLAENHGIDCLEEAGDLDGDWGELFGDYVPLATMFRVTSDSDDADSDDEPAFSKCFLVADISNAACPVALWDYDGPMIYPLADNLSDFVASRPPTSPRTGEWHASAYRKYSWT